MWKCIYEKIIEMKGNRKFVQSGAEPKAGAGALDAPRAEKLCMGKDGNFMKKLIRLKGMKRAMEQGVKVYLTKEGQEYLKGDKRGKHKFS